MTRVMITFPDELLEQVDRAAQAEHRNRSEFIREAVRRYLKQAVPLPQSMSIAEAIGIIEQLRSQSMERAEQAHDSTEIIRSFREPFDLDRKSDESTNFADEA